MYFSFCPNCRKKIKYKEIDQEEINYILFANFHVMRNKKNKNKMLNNYLTYSFSILYTDLHRLIRNLFASFPEHFSCI